MNSIQELLIKQMNVWTTAIAEKKSGRGRSLDTSGSIYGIDKLRALILQLAIRGKLLKQSPSDVPASELLSQITLYVNEAISEGLIRKQKSVCKVAESEQTFILPNGWEWVRLGQLGDWGAGATPLRSVSAYYGGGIPWFKSGELSDDLIGISEETVSKLAMDECSLRMNKPGDVLLAMYGATIGKASILAVEGTTNQAVCACSPYPGISSKYLLLLLKAMRANFISQGAGGAQPNISREKIIETPVALPPQDEQIRILEKVESLMALCDTLNSKSIASINAHKALTEEFLRILLRSKNAHEFRANWTLISNSFNVLFSSVDSVEALKLAILELAITGKLVPQDFGEESAEKLFERILRVKESLISEGRIKKIKAMPSNEAMKGIFCELPANWILRSLQDIYDVRDGTHDTPKYIDNGYPLVTSKNLYTGKLDFSDIKFISEEDHLKIKKRSEVNFGDVLFAMIGTIGNPVIVDIEEEFSIKNIALFKPYAAECAEMKYLLIFLKHITAQVKDNAAGAVQSFVSLSMLRNYPCPLPPLGEQKRIVKKVDELFLMCDQLKSLMENAAELQRTITDTLVDQALA